MKIASFGNQTAKEILPILSGLQRKARNCDTHYDYCVLQAAKVQKKVNKPFHKFIKFIGGSLIPTAQQWRALAREWKKDSGKYINVIKDCKELLQFKKV